MQMRASSARLKNRASEYSIEYSLSTRAHPINYALKSWLSRGRSGPKADRGCCMQQQSNVAAGTQRIALTLRSWLLEISDKVVSEC
eukprot:COSAG01_NODE_35072_length_537_cov_2.929224_1_plen_86_part_00